MKEHHGLAKQFIRIIALAALESVLLLTVSQVVLAKGLRFWFSRTEVQQHATQKQVQELQSYVTEHHLASTDPAGTLPGPDDDLLFVCTQRRDDLVSAAERHIGS